MSRMPGSIGEQIAAVYRRMADEIHYRPAAPSDGMGHITVPLAELDLDAEQRDYAADWWAEEDECTFHIGCADYRMRPVMILAVEAAKACCSDYPLARPLLEAALDELSKVTPRERA